MGFWKKFFEEEHKRTLSFKKQPFDYHWDNNLRDTVFSTVTDTSYSEIAGSICRKCSTENAQAYIKSFHSNGTIISITIAGEKSAVNRFFSYLSEFEHIKEMKY